MLSDRACLSLRESTKKGIQALVVVVIVVVVAVAVVVEEEEEAKCESEK